MKLTKIMDDNTFLKLLFNAKYLVTFAVAWFTWDTRCAIGEGALSLDAAGLTARAGGWQPRVALADQPLARGCHYWRLRIDDYDGDADPAFGIARAEVARDKMLG